MAVIINLYEMLARHKMKSKELAAYIGITEQNLSLLKSGKVKGIRFSTLENICQRLNCQPGIFLNIGLMHPDSTQTGRGPQKMKMAKRRKSVRASTATRHAGRRSHKALCLSLQSACAS